MPPKRKTPPAAAAEPDSAPQAKKAKEDNRAVFPRDRISPFPTASAASADGFVKIISWNVPGLRSAWKNHHAIFERLLAAHQPDVLCLQETKLQTEHVAEFESIFAALGFRSFWSCSEAKKGYSGTAVIIRQDLVSPATITPSATAKKSKTKKAAGASAAAGDEEKDQPSSAPASSAPASATSPKSVVRVSFGVPDSRFSGEGRVIAVEFPTFTLVNCYVPNSGQTLDRLDYRIKEWDPFMRAHLKSIHETSGKPVVYTGDLNVGHLDSDIYNFQAKHIVKQAGLTPQERKSFSDFLADGFTDAFRYFYPDAAGQFTYWSQRTMARSVNCGIRLDYFICTNDLFASPTTAPVAAGAGCRVASGGDGSEPTDATRVTPSTVPSPGVWDSFILHEDTVGCSDHCPVALLIRL